MQVIVIAPGGGTGINSAVYAELGQDPRFVVDFVGQSRAPYDVYPECWEHGRPVPNLVSFAEDVCNQACLERSDCMVFGSRGGQVVLPRLWELMGDRTPPSVCINGGCAMNLPQRAHWPIGAVTFLLIGGDDYFRGSATPEQYIAETKSWVPPSNSTTAVLYVDEMHHMPQAILLRSILPIMLSAVHIWKATGQPPKEELRHLLLALNSDGWSGRLSYTRAPGEWAPSVDFSPFDVAQHVASELERMAEAQAPTSPQAVELTRQQELRELLRASIVSAQPNGGAPIANASDRFHAVAQAALAKVAKEAAWTTAEGAWSPHSRPMLPLPPPTASPSVGGGPVAQRLPSGSPNGSTSGVPWFYPLLPSLPLYDATPVSRALGLRGPSFDGGTGAMGGVWAPPQWSDFSPEMRAHLVTMQAC